jgi:hypothetical protein
VTSRRPPPEARARLTFGRWSKTGTDDSVWCSGSTHRPPNERREGMREVRRARKERKHSARERLQAEDQRRAEGHDR